MFVKSIIQVKTDKRKDNVAVRGMKRIAIFLWENRQLCGNMRSKDKSISDNGNQGN